MVQRKSSRPPTDPWATALRLLTRRDYGTDELRRRLLDKGFAAAAVDAAIARGVELGYLDDARHVERLTRSLVTTGRATGPRLLRELRQRGLPEGLIHAAMTESRTTGAETTALRGLLTRRFPAFDFNAATERDRRRVVAFLQRRGFSLDQIFTELKRTDS